MKKIIHPLITISLSLLAFSSWAAKDTSYKSSDGCAACKELDAVVAKFGSTTRERERIDLSLKVAELIKKLKLEGKPELQKRALYFAINSAIEVKDADFDWQTAVELLDLRMRSPKLFDEVFHHFSKDQQEDLVDRMQYFIKEKFRPKAKLPKVQVED